MKGVGMTPRGRYSAQIVVSVAPEVRELLERMADDEGVSLAHVARKLLEAGLSAPTAPPGPPLPSRDQKSLRMAARRLVDSGEADDFGHALQILAETSEDPDTI